MKMLKLPALLMATVALSACESENTLKGNLVVSAPFKVKSAKTGNVITVGEKTFPATLKMGSKGAEAWIHYPDSSLVFNIPQVKEDKLGNVSLSPAQLKQEFGLQGKIFGKRTKFDHVVSESCVSGYNQETQCNWKDVCETDEEGNETCRHQYVCEQVDIPIYGSQDVRQIGYQDSKVVDIIVVKEGKAHAKFNGVYHYKAKVTSSYIVGSCF